MANFETHMAMAQQPAETDVLAGQFESIGEQPSILVRVAQFAHEHLPNSPKLPAAATAFLASFALAANAPAQNNSSEVYSKKPVATKKHSIYDPIAAKTVNGVLPVTGESTWLEKYGTKLILTPTTLQVTSNCNKSGATLSSIRMSYSPEITATDTTFCGGSSEHQEYPSYDPLFENPDKLEQRMEKVGAAALKFAHVNKTDGNVSRITLLPRRQKAKIQFSEGSLKAISVKADKVSPHFRSK